VISLFVTCIVIFFSFSNAIFHLHGQEALLTEQYFMKKGEDGEPKNGRNVDAKGGWDKTLGHFEQRLGWIDNNGIGKVATINARIPRQHDAGQHGKG
jgi:hypothetical protein